MHRLFVFLESLQAVWLQRACLTEQGAEYLGVQFRFPTSVDNGFATVDARRWEGELVGSGMPEARP